MTESQLLHLKVQATGLAAIVVAVLAISVWPGGVFGAILFLLGWATAIYVGISLWGFGKLGRRLSALMEVDVHVSRERFFLLYPWLKEEREARKQANRTAEADARESSARGSP